MGIAVPHRIGRHVHPDARPDLPAPPAAATGIDYLALVAARHRAELAARINYTDLPTSHPDEGPVEGHDGARATASMSGSKPSWPPSPRSATNSPTANCPANST